MELIPFPHAAQTRSRQMQLKLSRPDVVHNHMHVGPWEFECTRCDTPTKFECSSMIFRSMEFYCSSCGALHRVTNPAFAAPPAPKSK